MFFFPSPLLTSLMVILAILELNINFGCSIHQQQPYLVQCYSHNRKEWSINLIDIKYLFFFMIRHLHAYVGNVAHIGKPNSMKLQLSIQIADFQCPHLWNHLWNHFRWMCHEKSLSSEIQLAYVFVSPGSQFCLLYFQ